MKWLLRLLLWATALFVPCALVSGAYQRGLARIAAAILALFGQGVEIDTVEMMVPFDLAIFSAMCLATAAAPWPARRQAFAIGLPLLLGLEVVAVVLGIGVTLMWQEETPQLAASLRLTGYVIETVPWVGAALTWLVLLGPWALRALPEPPGALLPPGTRGARAGKRC